MFLQSQFRTICEMCDRKHDSIEPMIHIRKDGLVRFYCNRRKGEKIFIVLGNIQLSGENQYGSEDEDEDEDTAAARRLAICGKQKPIAEPKTYSSTVIINHYFAVMEDTSIFPIIWSDHNIGIGLLPLVKAYHSFIGSETMLSAEFMALKSFYTTAGYRILTWPHWKACWDPNERHMTQPLEIPSHLFGESYDIFTDIRQVHRLMCRDLMRSCRILGEKTHHYICLVVRIDGSLGMEDVLKTYFTQPRFTFRHQNERIENRGSGDNVPIQPKYKIAIFWGDFNAEIMSINRKIGVTSCNQIFNQLLQDYRLINQQASDVDIDNAIRNGTGSIADLANNYIRNGLRNNQISRHQCCLVDVFTVDKMMCPFNIVERSPQYITRYIEPAITRNRQEILYPSVMYRYHKFILDVCGGNIEACYNILNVLRFSLITGEKCPKCIFLCGPSGSGKSSFCQMISKIYGTDNTSPISFDHLNATFNSWVEKRLIVIEESNVTSRKSLNSGVLNKLKDIITNTSVRMERKNQEAITIENNCLLMICADRMEKIIDKGLIRRFIAVTPLHNGDFGDAEQGDLLELKQPENLRQLVAYLTSTPEEIAQWNTILPYDEQLYTLDSIENIRKTCELMIDSKSKYSRGNTPQEKCWKALKEGHMKFPYELCFAKSDNKCWKAGAGQLYIHPIGFHTMFYRLMVSGGCTTEERYDMFATEATKKIAHNDGNDNVTREMFGHSAKHKGKIEMRRLVDNWLTIWKLDDLGRRYTVNPGFESFFMEQIRLETLQTCEKFESLTFRWYRINKEWFDAYKEICEKPEDQVYPHFNVINRIDIGLSSSRAKIDKSLHECIRVIEPKGTVQEASTSSEAEDILWATPVVSFEQQTVTAQPTAWWN